MTLWCLDLKSPWRARRPSARPCLCYIAWRLEKRYKNEDSFWWCLWNGFVCLLGKAEIVWNWCFLGIRLDDCWIGSMAHVWGSDGPWTSRVAAADATSSSKRGRDRWLKLAIRRTLREWNEIDTGSTLAYLLKGNITPMQAKMIGVGHCWSVHQPAMESFGCSCFAPRFGCTRQGLLVFFLLIWSISLLRHVSTWSTFRLRQPMPPKGSELENEVQRSNSNDCLSTFGIWGQIHGGLLIPSCSTLKGVM